MQLAHDRDLILLTDEKVTINFKLAFLCILVVYSTGHECQ